jgi:hypothetical protein
MNSWQAKWQSRSANRSRAMLPWLALWLLLAVWLATLPQASAQSGEQAVQPVPWSALNSEQQRLLARFETNWQQFPAGRQQALASAHGNASGSGATWTTTSAAKCADVGSNLSS